MYYIEHLVIMLTALFVLLVFLLSGHALMSFVRVTVTSVAQLFRQRHAPTAGSSASLAGVSFESIAKSCGGGGGGCGTTTLSGTGGGGRPEHEKITSFSRKYELTNDTRDIGGSTVYRIRALRDFSDVKAGDLGGFIGQESNLSHYGDCWVYDDAIVLDRAMLRDYAAARHHAMVLDYAIVRDYAVALDRSIVRDSAILSGLGAAIDDQILSGTNRVYKNNDGETAMPLENEKARKSMTNDEILNVVKARKEGEAIKMMSIDNCGLYTWYDMRDCDNFDFNKFIYKVTQKT